MQESASNQVLNEVLEKILAALRSVNEIQEKGRKLSALSKVDTILKEHLAVLKKSLAHNPQTMLNYEFYDCVNDIFHTLLKWRIDDEIRSLVPQTLLPVLLQDLVNTLREVLRRLPEAVAWVTESPTKDTATRQFYEAVLAWDITQLPRTIEIFKAAEDYYYLLQEKSNQAREAWQTTNQACEEMSAAIKKKQQQEPMIVDPQAQAQLLHQTLVMFAQNAALTLTMQEATAAQIAITELAEEVLAVPDGEHSD